MSVKQTRVSLKGMTDEEKKERKRVQMREYMAKRKKEDTVFADKQREYVRNNNKLIQPLVYSERKQQYNAKYYEKKKNRLKELEELVRGFRPPATKDELVANLAKL